MTKGTANKEFQEFNSSLLLSTTDFETKSDTNNEYISNSYLLECYFSIIVSLCGLNAPFTTKEFEKNFFIYNLDNAPTFKNTCQKNPRYDQSINDKTENSTLILCYKSIYSTINI